MLGEGPREPIAAIHGPRIFLYVVLVLQITVIVLMLMIAMLFTPGDEPDQVRSAGQGILALIYSLGGVWAVRICALSVAWVALVHTPKYWFRIRRNQPLVELYSDYIGFPSDPHSPDVPLDRVQSASVSAESSVLHQITLNYTLSARPDEMLTATISADAGTMAPFVAHLRSLNLLSQPDTYASGRGLA